MNPLPSLPRRTLLKTLAATGLTSLSPALSAAPSSKIRVAQIGTKHAHAAGKLESILKFPQIFDCIGIVEPDPTQQQLCKNNKPYQGLPWLTEESLLSEQKPDLILVETEVSQLVPTAMRCIAAGAHVHVDKPAGAELDACRQMHALAAKNQRLIQMGYMLRYNPAFQLLKKAVQEGWLGEITELSGMMGKLGDDTSRRQLAQFPGGGMFELACHLIDQVVWLLGAPRNVTPFIRRSRAAEDSFADNQMAVLEYPLAIADIRCNFLDPMGGPRRQFTVTGTKGTFEIRPMEPTPMVRMGLSESCTSYPKGWHDIHFEKPSGRYDGEFLDLADAIISQRPLAWDATHDLTVQETVLRASGMLTSE